VSRNIIIMLLQVYLANVMGPRSMPSGPLTSQPRSNLTRVKISSLWVSKRWVQYEANQGFPVCRLLIR
jgi:hypothetical protein